ncbi:Serine protease inhibitor 3/4, partial [Lamellibrachia satsuma]
DFINDWVEQQTNNKIKDLLSAEAVEDAVLVLVNAIYFKARWENQFDPTITRNGTFHLSTSQTVPVKMMSKRGKFRYSENRQLQCKILELPYTGKRLAMYVLLPNEIDGLSSLESKVTYTSVISALAMLRSE